MSSWFRSSNKNNAASGSEGAQPNKEYGADWGSSPEGPPEAENNSDELVLQTWANCKAKKNPLHQYRTDVDEKHRRESIQWRKRASFIQLDCGEDSFFVSNTYKVVGIADGVGGWKDKGVDPSRMSNKLMENAKLYSETHRNVLDARQILTEAYNKVLANKEVPAGSTTACIACLRPGGSESTGILDICNLGDSGALLIRNRLAIQRVHEKIHGFNAPFQLAVVPDRFLATSFNDHPRDAVREQWEVQEGDVLLLATDGLFDNMFVPAISENAGWIGNVMDDAYSQVPLIGPVLRQVLGQKKVTFTDPFRVVQRLVNEAFRLSNDVKAVTPWSQSVQEFFEGHPGTGGKPDDITVVLSRIVKRDELKRTPMW